MRLDRDGIHSGVPWRVCCGATETPLGWEPLTDGAGVGSGLIRPACNGSGPTSPALDTLVPGFRSHDVDNEYLPSMVELPTTFPPPYDYWLLVGIMKV
jgi:hypothetical protein